MNDSTPSSSFPADGNAPLPPPRIPDHELIRRIGRGAYGEVWLARSVTGAFRAVKIVRRSSFDHERPFEREFEGIQKFEPVSRTHDSQVDILHVGRGEDYFYYVMELADDQVTGGQINPDNYHPRTLKSDLLFHSRLSFEECVSIGIALTTALEHLHKSGLVHRDVKPSNIIFVNGVAKLADIGLVTGVDTTRSYVGTEGFAAPEGPGTAQGDLFSLGKVLYEMSTGKDRQEFPELPTNLRELPDREGLVELNSVIARACRHDPRDRYPNASAMRADLELLQSGASLARLRRTELRLRFVSRAGAAVTALAVLVISGWIYQRVQTREARRLTEENRLLAEANREQIIQLNTGNGIRQMKAGSSAEAMFWFSKALQQLTNDPVRLEEHKLRLSTLIDLQPKLVAVLPCEKEIDLVVSANRKRLLTRTASGLDLWDLKVPLRRIATIPTEDGWNSALHSYHLTPEGDRVIVLRRDMPALIWTVSSDGNSRCVVIPGPPLKQSTGNFSATPGILPAMTTNNVFVRIDLATGKAIPPMVDVGSYDMREVAPLTDTFSFGKTNEPWRLIDTASGAISEGPILKSTWVLRPVSRGRRLLGFTRHVSGNLTVPLQLFDAKTGALIGPPIRHSRHLIFHTFSPDATILATASFDRTARLWSLVSGDPVSPPLHDPAGIISVAVSQDNRRAATMAADGSIRIWDVHSGRQLGVAIFSGAAGLLAFAAGDSLLLAATVDGAVRVWDMTSMDQEGTRLALNDRAELLRFSPNGTRLFGGGSKHHALWESDGRLVTNDFADFQPKYAEFSPNSRHLAVSDASGLLRVFDSGTGAPVSSLLSTHSLPWFNFSPDGNELATIGIDGNIQFWDWRNAKQSRVSHRFENAGNLRWSPSGKHILVMFGDGRRDMFTLIDLEKGVPLWPGKERTGGPLRLSPDGRRIAFGRHYGSIDVIDASTGKIERSFLHNARILNIQFSANGEHLLAGSIDGTAALWNVVSGEKIRTFASIGDDGSASIEFHSNGRFVVAPNQKGNVRFWSTQTGEPLSPPLGSESSEILPVIHPTKPIVAAGIGGEILLNDYSPTVRSTEDLLAIAHLVCGGRIDSLTVGDALSVAETSRLHEQLRARMPTEFASSPAVVARWHERNSSAADWGDSPYAALVHLDELMALQPERLELKSRRAELLALKPLPRDPATPSNLIDLSEHYNAYLDQAGGSYREIPRGLQEFAGTRWDIRAAVTLENQQADTEHTVGTRISHIRVGQRCKALHFLHAARSNLPTGAEIARYVFHFANQTSVDWPICYGQHARHWRRSSSEQDKGASHAALAWEGARESANKVSYSRLYKTTWVNPHPDVEITHIEFISGNSIAKPFVVAITAE